MPDIDRVQRAMIREFAMVGTVPEVVLEYLMDIGASMPVLESRYKTSAYLVPGCLSRVWLVQEERGGRIYLRADSDAAITKGLVSLLVRIFSGQGAEDIARAELFLLPELPLYDLIGVQRRGGFEQMLKRIKEYARGVVMRKVIFVEK